jgi:hypothetical protein
MDDGRKPNKPPIETFKTPDGYLVDVIVDQPRGSFALSTTLDGTQTFPTREEAVAVAVAKMAVGHPPGKPWPNKPKPKVRRR